MKPFIMCHICKREYGIVRSRNRASYAAERLPAPGHPFRAYNDSRGAKLRRTRWNARMTVAYARRERLIAH